MNWRLGERVLSRLSSAPPPRILRSNTSVEAALRELGQVLPDLPSLVRGRSVLDFGCGTGYQAVALVRAGADRVVGLDINERWLDRARSLAAEHALEGRIEFRSVLCSDVRFDLVFSYNSMEHFRDPAAVLSSMCAATRIGGHILIAFGLPWYSAYGAHMHHITKVPWVHLLFSERTVMRVRARYMNDGALRYEDVEGGLNRMSIRRFEKLTRASGMGIEYLRLTPMRGLPLVTRIPVLRELFTTRVVALLQRLPDGLQNHAEQT